MKDNKPFVGLSFAWNGLLHVIKNERNLRIHIFITIVVIAIGYYFTLTLIEWTIIFLVIGFVLVTEVFNTVVEELINYLNPTIHPTAKVIKDMAAGAVLLAAIFSIIIGLLIFAPKVYELF